MPPSFNTYNINNLHAIPQLSSLPDHLREAVSVVGRVFPFRTNNYVVNELIDWERAEDDPMFRLNFPCREMLLPQHYEMIRSHLLPGSPKEELLQAIKAVRCQMKPCSAGSMGDTMPAINGRKDRGIMHSYPETVLFFPAEGQMCHAHCTFCFRWIQFVGDDEEIFTSTDVSSLVDYVSQRRQVKDILFTGGDPLFMKTGVLSDYLDRVLAADMAHVTALRFGTKSISYWPYRFLTDVDADDLLRLFERVIAKGKHVAIVANINHPDELATDAAKKAIARILSTGAVIRTQSPLLRHINDKPEILANLWQEEVRLGLVPYYQFIVRDTGARHYFAVPLVAAQGIFMEAYRRVSGICRTVRGPCMSTPRGKVEVLGVQDVQGEKIIALRYLQSQDQAQVLKTFFAKFDATAEWFTDLKPFRPEDSPFFTG